MGGLGPKKVDVSYSDEQHGLLLAVSIKTISFAPFGKNLKNRFGDLCTEAITLHMRFPYSVVCALFAFPSACDQDFKQPRSLSTFRVATRLFSTISGRREYTDPGEKFENVTMMLFQPVFDRRSASGQAFRRTDGEGDARSRVLQTAVGHLQSPQPARAHRNARRRSRALRRGPPSYPSGRSVAFAASALKYIRRSWWNATFARCGADTALAPTSTGAFGSLRDFTQSRKF